MGISIPPDAGEKIACRAIEWGLYVFAAICTALLVAAFMARKLLAVPRVS